MEVLYLIEFFSSQVHNITWQDFQIQKGIRCNDGDSRN